MNWPRVAKALDDEWWRCSNAMTNGHLSPNEAAKKHLELRGAIAFMFRDALVCGMDKNERKEFEALTGR